MADLDRLQQDLGFVRHTVTHSGRRPPVSHYFLWSAITLCGFVLADLRPPLMGVYWMIAGPLGGLISGYLSFATGKEMYALEDKCVGKGDTACHVMIKTEEARDSSELQGRRGGYGHAARLALKDLPPGSYVLTVSARSRLGEMPSAERQVQFTVTAPRAVPSR